MSNSDARLAAIQQLQFTDRAAAEALLLSFIQDTFPQLTARHVRLRPLAVSLNSFNGFITLDDGQQLFFKTHVEPSSVIQEYYNAALLAEAGYPLIRPRYASTEYGKQFLIYEVIEAPSVFDVARRIEQEMGDAEALTHAQQAADDALWQIYQRTWAHQTGAEAEPAAIHQLFAHRLGQRYHDFYVAKSFTLPAGSLGWDALLRRLWIINGCHYSTPLGQVIASARHLLRPAQEGWSIVGHGDAHNGNVFLTETGLLYFDPAFGGRHHPLLDVTKPLFHNVFATWMYHPLEVADSLHITWHDDGTTITVEHDYHPSPIRHMFWESKVSRVLAPTVRQLAWPHWEGYLRAALMCCPLLTMNLSDRVKFPAEVGLLGLCYVVQLGSASQLGAGRLRSLIDETFSALSSG